MRDVIGSLPARPPTPAERALLAEWLAAAGDIALAYVSGRQGDDPALRNRIIIVIDPAQGPSHLIHAPASRDIWMVLSRGRRTGVRRFPTLQAALNSIRPVLLADAAAGQPARET
jgi:hypothetical protein